jgi:hypothetical protein
MIALMMEAVGMEKQKSHYLFGEMLCQVSETSVNFYQTTRRKFPDDSYLHTRRRENLKSYHFPDHFVFKHI